MERFRGELFAIRKLGEAVHRKAREYGVNSVNPAYMTRLGLALTEVYSVPSAKHLFEISDPQYPAGAFFNILSAC